ncbi:hypothetical protein [Actinacidiphila sp. ITFR-21]|uniref:hypothetical protein n=1 Tax=Actinacidiphila sp. ITFR-21 TaxID=3075199 RepID=UPI00288B52C7|nr:hypothetical protein [Streptomyces sp. ITFR-21]WNI19136.1 hypothetical protein RLT57_28770 [Streptomyces sp. ITFR-21]
MTGLDPGALCAAAVCTAGLVLLVLAAIGAAVLTRAVLAWMDAQAADRAWRRRTTHAAPPAVYEPNADRAEPASELAWLRQQFPDAPPWEDQ